MNIVAITGTNGAGKGTITDILTKQFSYIHLSVRELLEEILYSQNLEPTRDNMIKLANNFRRDAGPSILIEMLLDRANELGANVIIESIRCPGEIHMLRKKYPDVKIISVDAKQELRYERVINRGSNTDNISFTAFLEQEGREMSNKDPFEQNLAECIRLADIHFTNNSTIEDLEADVTSCFAHNELRQELGDIS